MSAENPTPAEVFEFFRNKCNSLEPRDAMVVPVGGMKVMTAEYARLVEVERAVVAKKTEVKK